MDYGVYKGIRGAAWQCLLDCDIDELPVSIGKIMRHYNLPVIYNSTVNILKPDEAGEIIVYGNAPIVVINDKIYQPRLRYTVMHELGHYVLGHLGDVGALSRSNVKAPQEREADMFAARVLMPSCVLWGLDLREPAEIALTCDVSLQAAAYRAQRMAILRKRNKFLTDPLEKAVFEQFGQFIDKNRK